MPVCMFILTRSFGSTKYLNASLCFSMCVCMQSLFGISDPGNASMFRHVCVCVCVCVSK